MKWKVLASEILFKSRFIQFRVERCLTSSGLEMPKYYKFDFPDWVQVVALRSDGQVVLLRQYRHGAGEDFLEVPGGSMDPGSKESPLTAAQRELREETGMTSRHWKNLGFVYPNPALQSNKIHVFLAEHCEATHALERDPFEEMEIECCSVSELLLRLDQGEFQHALMMASLGLARSELFKIASSNQPDPT